MTVKSNIYDVLIIGGGINGLGIAHEAASQGLKVILCEQADFASGTSSKSSRFIHGGLRYLEQGAFRLVYESLAEREALIKLAPHLVKKIQCCIPIHPDYRAYLKIKAGLLLYNFFSRTSGKLWPQTLDYQTQQTKPLFQARIKKALLYEDAWTDDSRLVITVALAAQQVGARLYKNSQVISAVRDSVQKVWQVMVKQDEQVVSYQARVLVNAAGPYVDSVLKFCQPNTPAHLRLVQGSHIVVPKLKINSECYVLQTKDNRIVFTAPYEEKYTMIGTTDIDISSNRIGVNYNNLHPQQDEIDYLLQCYNDYFKQPLSAAHIHYAYSGVRPLIKTASDSPQANTRDYQLVMHDDDDIPLCSVIGGKITTFRALAKKALLKIKPYFPNKIFQAEMKRNYPGGDLEGLSFDEFKKNRLIKYSFLNTTMLNRYIHNYGARIDELLADVSSVNQLGKEVLPNLYEKEIEFLKNTEWCTSVDDLLWRRSKLGLEYNKQQVMLLEEYWR